MFRHDIAFAAVGRVLLIRKGRLTGRDLRRPAVEARMLFILLASEHGRSDYHISLMLHRDRSTVSRGRANAARLLDVDGPFAAKLQALRLEYAAMMKKLGSY